MLNRTTAYIITACTALCCMFVFSSCRHDDAVIEEALSGETIDVPFELILPEVNAVETRLTEAQEKAVNTLHVLVFDKNNKFKYASKGNNSDGIFTVKLTRGMHNLMFLANAETILSSIYPDGIPANTTKAEVEAALVLTQSGKWSASDLPMWGNLPTVDVKNDQNYSVTLYRMHAAIDVTNSASTFALSNVYLYQASIKGRLAPAYDNSTIWHSDGYATAPTSPSSGYGSTSAQQSYTVSNNACKNQIYTPEAAQGIAYLIVRGTYKSTQYYYKIDLGTITASSDPEQSATVSYLPLLRNHRYTVNITGVNGPGHAAIKDAQESKSNLQTTITAWNEAELYEIKRDGDNVLGVSKTDINLRWAQTTTTFKVKTNGTAATVSCTSGSSYASVTKGTTTNGMTTYTVNFTSENNTGYDRNAVFGVTLGKLSTSVTVKQAKEGSGTMRVYLSDGSLVPNGVYSSSRYITSGDYKKDTYFSFRVEWDDKDEPLIVYAAHPYEEYETWVWTTINGCDDLSGTNNFYGGVKNFRICGKAFYDCDPSGKTYTGEKQKAVTLTLSTVGGGFVKFDLVQASPYIELIPKTVDVDVTLANSPSVEFEFYSNMETKISGVTDGGSVAYCYDEPSTLINSTPEVSSPSLYNFNIRKHKYEIKPNSHPADKVYQVHGRTSSITLDGAFETAYVKNQGTHTLRQVWSPGTTPGEQRNTIKTSDGTLWKTTWTGSFAFTEPLRQDDNDYGTGSFYWRIPPAPFSGFGLPTRAQLRDIHKYSKTYENKRLFTSPSWLQNWGNYWNSAYTQCQNLYCSDKDIYWMVKVDDRIYAYLSGTASGTQTSRDINGPKLSDTSSYATGYTYAIAVDKFDYWCVTNGPNKNEYKDDKYSDWENVRRWLTENSWEDMASLGYRYYDDWRNRCAEASSSDNTVVQHPHDWLAFRTITWYGKAGSHTSDGWYACYGMGQIRYVVTGY